MNTFTQGGPNQAVFMGRPLVFCVNNTKSEHFISMVKSVTTAGNVHRNKGFTLGSNFATIGRNIISASREIITTGRNVTTIGSKNGTKPLL